MVLKRFPTQSIFTNSFWPLYCTWSIKNALCLEVVFWNQLTISFLQIHNFIDIWKIYKLSNSENVSTLYIVVLSYETKLDLLKFKYTAINIRVTNHLKQNILFHILLFTIILSLLYLVSWTSHLAETNFQNRNMNSWFHCWDNQFHRISSESTLKREGLQPSYSWS